MSLLLSLEGWSYTTQLGDLQKSERVPQVTFYIKNLKSFIYFLFC